MGSCVFRHFGNSRGHTENIASLELPRSEQIAQKESGNKTKQRAKGKLQGRLLRHSKLPSCKSIVSYRAFAVSEIKKVSDGNSNDTCHVSNVVEQERACRLEQDSFQKSSTIHSSTTYAGRQRENTHSSF